MGSLICNVVITCIITNTSSSKKKIISLFVEGMYDILNKISLYNDSITNNINISRTDREIYVPILEDNQYDILKQKYKKCCYNNVRLFISAIVVQIQDVVLQESEMIGFFSKVVI